MDALPLGPQGGSCVQGLCGPRTINQSVALYIWLFTTDLLFSLLFTSDQCYEPFHGFMDPSE